MRDDICPFCGKVRCKACPEDAHWSSCPTYLTDKDVEDPDCFFLKHGVCNMSKEECPFVDSRDFDSCKYLSR